jgi:hypothetical protein
MEPAAYVNYKLQIQGLFFVGLIVGVVLAEIFCSGRLSDWIVRRLTLKNGGERLPEMRLWLGYPAAVSSSIGLIAWGLSIEIANGIGWWGRLLSYVSRVGTGNSACVLTG